MYITVYTGEQYHQYDLSAHRLDFKDGELWVSTDTAYLSDSLVVAVFAKGEWKRVELDRE